MEKRTKQYLAALEEAASYFKNGKDVPVTVVEKAIGKRPAFCDSPDRDALHEAMNALNQYRVEETAFLNAAFHLAKS